MSNLSPKASVAFLRNAIIFNCPILNYLGRTVFFGEGGGGIKVFIDVEGWSRFRKFWIVSSPFSDAREFPGPGITKTR